MTPPIRLLVASTNRGKVREVAALLDNLGLEVVGLDAYPAPPDLPEPYTTFAENARSKALAAADLAGCLALADDSGLEIAALGGRPGVHSSRYAPDDRTRITKLLTEMAGLEGEQRQARFVCALALARPGRILGLWQETCHGLIAHQPRGTHGFGFDPLFLFGDRTFAEMPTEEKSAVSHRGKALHRFMADLPGLLDELR